MLPTGTAVTLVFELIPSRRLLTWLLPVL